jgi:predicted Zn-dependent protease
MRFACPALTPRPTFRSLLLLSACLLPLILSSPPASAQGRTHDAPSIQSSEDTSSDDAYDIDQKKSDKYDINRIGQRGIGHGFNLYSQKREQELGRSLASAFDHNTKVVKDELVNDYVNRIAQKIVGNSDADVPFTIKIIDSGDIPRAYGLPGGFLYVDSALILASEGEAELATIMAHEIAHVAARHATRAMSRKQMMHIVNSVAFMTGPVGAGAADVGGFAGPLSLKKFSRDAEYEADLLGIEYAYASGYDPQAMMGALEKLHALELKRDANLAKIPGYRLASSLPFHSKIARGLANYPLTEERIQRLHSEIAHFLPSRNDYVLDTDEFQEVKSRLLAYHTPVLRHHGAGDDDNKGPVLRRNTDTGPDPEVLQTSAAPLNQITHSMVRRVP